jgi:diguanylate cyclase (GGDEF)-like protein
MNGCLAFALASSPILFIRCISFLCVITAFTYCVSIHNQHKVIEEQVRSRRRLRNLANNDWLTGLPNRHSFETFFEKVCASGASFTLWMLDLDGFKEVNDTHGHAVGDELLKQVAQRLENGVRAEDLLARLGGDEFVILQTQAHSRNSTRKLAERLEAEIGAPYFIDGHRITISASVGIKVSASGEQNPQDALLEADRALYRVKGTGHGGFEFV